MSIIETIANNPDSGLSQSARDAMLACVAKRGKGKGDLLRTCPPGYGPDAAAWQCLMLYANPYKASIGRVLFMRDEARAIHREIDEWIIAHPGVAGQILNCDRDRRNLTKLGAW